MKKVCWLLLVGLTVMAVPSHAIFFGCEDICNCSVSCLKSCRISPTSPVTNCGNAGEDCFGSPGCSGFAFADLASDQVCTAEASEAPAAPAPVQPAAAD